MKHKTHPGHSLMPYCKLNLKRRVKSEPSFTLALKEDRDAMNTLDSDCMHHVSGPYGPEAEKPLPRLTIFWPLTQDIVNVSATVSHSFHIDVSVSRHY